MSSVSSDSSASSSSSSISSSPSPSQPDQLKSFSLIPPNSSASTSTSSSDSLSTSDFHLGVDSFSDISIQYGRSIFHCHRAVLCLRSRVFTALFEDSSTHLIEIPQQRRATGGSISEPEFHRFLKTMYFPDSLTPPLIFKESFNHNEIESILHLSHYFHSEIYLDSLFGLIFPTDLNNLIDEYWKILFWADYYHISGILNSLIIHGGNYYRYYSFDSTRAKELKQKYFMLLSHSTQIKLLETSLVKYFQGNRSLYDNYPNENSIRKILEELKLILKEDSLSTVAAASSKSIISQISGERKVA